MVNFDSIGSADQERARSVLKKSVESARRAVTVLPGDMRARQWMGELAIAETMLDAARERAMGELKLVSYDFGRDNVVMRFADPKRKAEIRKGDLVHGGVLVRTSRPHGGEADGRMRVDTLLYRLVCSNGAIFDEGFSRHVGRRYDSLERARDEMGVRDFEDAASDIAKRATRLFVEAVEVVDYEASFERFRHAANDPIGLGPAIVIENVAKRLNLTEPEIILVHEEMERGDDPTRYGVVNALTSAAQRIGVRDPLRRIDFEKFGGNIASLHRHDWQVLAHPAPVGGTPDGKPIGYGGAMAHAAVKNIRRRRH